MHHRTTTPGGVPKFIKDVSCKYSSLWLRKADQLGEEEEEDGRSWGASLAGLEGSEAEGSGRRLTGGRKYLTIWERVGATREKLRGWRAV